MISSRREIPRNSWVMAPTYCVTEPAPNAPAHAFRQTKAYTAPVRTAVTHWDSALQSPMGPLAILAMVDPVTKLRSRLK